MNNSTAGPIRRLVRYTLISGSSYMAACLSSAGLLALCAELMGKVSIAWFWYGFCIPIGPLFLFYSSGWVMERQLNRLKKWHEGGVLNQVEYREQRKAALAWYRRLRYPPNESHGSIGRPQAEVVLPNEDRPEPA